MAEIPRKPTFPDHVVRKVLQKIQQEVEDNVIPVSTGIYSEEKLVAQLQAIPKPVLADYDDRIFYEVIEKEGICQLSACPVCHYDFTNRKKPIMCHFCSNWCCEECICHRQRLHPLDNNPNGKRFSICYDCDGKYLALQLGHPYVENRILIQTAIIQVSKELEDVERKLQTEKRRIDTIKGQPKRKLNMRVAILKKQDLDIRKNIKKTNWDIQAEKDKMSKLQQKICEVKARQQKRQERNKQKEEQRIMEEKQKQIYEKLRIDSLKQQERVRKEKQQLDRVERQYLQKQKQRLKVLEEELQREKEKQKKKQKEREAELEKQKQKILLKQLERKQQLEEQRKRERQNQLLKKREMQQKEKQRNQELQRQRKVEIQRKQEELRQQQAAKEDQNFKRNQQTGILGSIEPDQRIGNQCRQLDQHTQISYMIDPSSNERTHDTEHEQVNQNQKNKNAYLYNQFKNYFTEEIITNTQQLDEAAPSGKSIQQNQSMSHLQKEHLFGLFRKSLEQSEVKAAESPDIEVAKMEIMKEANKKRRNWEDMNNEVEQPEVIGGGQKCKCVVF